MPILLYLVPINCQVQSKPKNKLDVLVLFLAFWRQLLRHAWFLGRDQG